MRIYYGTIDKFIDITDICFNKLKDNEIITIPLGDFNRANHFTDPLLGTRKNIIIENNDIITEYNEDYMIKINIIDKTINAININDIDNKLQKIHSKLKINYGDMQGELPEQTMSVIYLTGNEKVLEIGGNIGRNSLVISSILNDSNNLVTLESNIETANILEENRDINNFKFNVEASALSKRKLIQRGWDTIPSAILYEGFNWVNTITLDELKTKYKINFDTLVLDCEGAFYYILMDMPDILNNIKLIIMENDYYDTDHKKYVDETLKKNNFYRDYLKVGGWYKPSYDNFYEVWKRNS